MSLADDLRKLADASMRVIEIQKDVITKTMFLYEDYMELQVKCAKLEKTVAELTKSKTSGPSIKVQKFSEKDCEVEPEVSGSPLVIKGSKTPAQDRLRKFRQ